MEFLRDEREEEAVWQAQIEAGSRIQNHLDRALELHRTTDYQISQVSGSSLRIVRILALILFVLPMPFLLQRLRDISRKKSAEMTRLYSHVRWLGQHNAGLVHQNDDANMKMTDLEARRQALEEELARTAGERDVQRAAAEQKAQETEAQTTELQLTRMALEQREAELQRKETKLQGKEAELQREKATVATLTGTLEEKGKALEEREEALWNTEAALKEAQKNIAGECSKFQCCWILVFRNLSLFP